MFSRTFGCLFLSMLSFMSACLLLICVYRESPVSSLHVPDLAAFTTGATSQLRVLVSGLLSCPTQNSVPLVMEGDHKGEAAD